MCSIENCHQMNTMIQSQNPVLSLPSVTPDDNNVAGLWPLNSLNLEEFEGLPLKRPLQQNLPPIPRMEYFHVMSNSIQSQSPFNNAVGFLSPSPMNPEECEEPAIKKLRSSNEAPIQIPPAVPNMPAPPRAANSMFFKTRLCARFKSSSCPYGNYCSFAHGPEELRKPPPNWQEVVTANGNNGCSEQQRVQKRKICRKFYNGESCPYGERCIFVHEKPGRFPESSPAMGSTAVAEPIVGDNRSDSRLSERTGLNVCSTENCSGSNRQSTLWKSRICSKWELMGNCPLGKKCNFAHGHAELNKYGGRMELDQLNIRAAPLTSLLNLANDVSPIKSEPNSKHQAQEKKGFLKLKGLKKINGIYGDWPDDMPLFPRSTTSKFEA